jgi:hypothetical protein
MTIQCYPYPPSQSLRSLSDLSDHVELGKRSETRLGLAPPLVNYNNITNVIEIVKLRRSEGRSEDVNVSCIALVEPPCNRNRIYLKKAMALKREIFPVKTKSKPRSFGYLYCTWSAQVWTETDCRRIYGIDMNTAEHVKIRSIDWSRLRSCELSPGMQTDR